MKLQAFLYILIRDEITIGRIESIMRDLPGNADGRSEFSCSELADYSNRLKKRLLEE